MKKTESIKMSELIKIVKPEYEYLKLKPNNSIRNNSTDRIARAISTINQSISQKLKPTEKRVINFLGKDIVYPTGYTYYSTPKVSFIIYMERKTVDFYFIVPKSHSTFLKEKMNDVWKGVTIETVDSLPNINNSLKNQMYFSKEDGLSLTVDKRDNDLISSILNVVESLETNENLSVLYNFNHISQKGWRNVHNSTVTKFNEHKPVDRDKGNIGYWVKWGFILLDSIVNTIFDSISGTDNKTRSREDLFTSALVKFGQERKLSPASINKGKSIVNSMELVVSSYSINETRQKNLLQSLSQSFDSISGDNSLVSKPFRKEINYESKYLAAEKNVVSDLESQHFISLVGKDILERYKFIDHVETLETEVPIDLQEGVMCIGENIYRGNHQTAYISNDFEFRNLLLLLIAPTRAGKSNLLGHLCIDAVENDECVIVFDYIENCELSDNIARPFPKKQVLTIDCSDPRSLQGLGYNEVGSDENPFKQYELAKKQTASIISLINSINVDNSQLSAKMERYLESASLVVFINNGSFKDVFKVLTNHHVRYDYISKTDRKYNEYLEEYIEGLYELDDLDKEKEVVGTKTHLITGIIDRFSVLKRNTYLELMLKKGTENNINLVEEIQKNQLIVIKMPQATFQTEGERDTITLYWLTKLWISLMVRAEKVRDRKQRKKVNFIIDELYQAPNVEKFIKRILSQIAKFGAKPIVTCHYINQLQYLREELRSANTSYMLLAGCDSKNFDELKTELQPFTVDDLLNMKMFHSLNYMKNKTGYAKFITALPPAVEKRKIKTIKSNEVIIHDIEDQW